MARRYNYQTDGVPMDPVGPHQTDTTISSATPLTPPAGADRVLIQALDQDVRYTLDGTTPTASVGFRLYEGDATIIQIGAGMVVTVIEEAAGASLAYQWGS